MSTRSENGFFVEPGAYSLLLARTASLQLPLVIEDVREISLTDKAAVDAALKAVFPGGASPDHTTAGLRPPLRLHLATADEAKRHASLPEIQKFASQNPALAALPPGYFSVLPARQGAGAPWLLAATTTADHDKVLASLAEFALKPTRPVSAGLHGVNALLALLKTRGTDVPVLLLDIGPTVSHALLISRRGVELVGSLTFSIDTIAEAVQAELGLTFKGSAAKLFFNELYDFSETGPKIIARLAPALKTALAALQGPAAAELLCAGLPAKQQWFATQLTTALGLKPYAPDLRAWCAGAGLKFASPALEASLSPAWIGFLQLIGASHHDAPVQAEWLPLHAAIPVPTAAPAPNPIKSAPPTKAAASAPAIPSKPPSPAPTTTAKTPSPPAKPVESSASYSAKAGAKAADPKPAASTPVPTPATAATPVAPKKKSLAVPIGALAAVLVLGGVGFLYVQSQNEAKLLAQENERKEQRLKDEAAKRTLAEQKAREEAEQRKKTESDLASKLAAAESARQQAENEARHQASARLANARGTLVITTVPTGATVTVGDLPPRPSPATFADIRIGRYPVTITLANHDEVKFEAAVTENATATPPPVPLASTVGGLELVTEPAGATYEFHPAGGFVIDPAGRRTGQTPATLADLPAGDYAVTFTREGWAPRTETVTVARGATARAAWTFPNGVVKITSNPAGAQVTRGGVKLGATPLTLADQKPGEAQFEMSHPNFETLRRAGRVESGRTLEIAVEFPAADRLYVLSELDRKPEPINAKPPEVPYYLAVEKGSAEIQLILDRDGTPHDVQVVRATDKVLGKLYLTAVSAWKFKPATVQGKPVKARLVLPFTVTPPKS